MAPWLALSPSRLLPALVQWLAGLGLRARAVEFRRQLVSLINVCWQLCGEGWDAWVAVSRGARDGLLRAAMPMPMASPPSGRALTLTWPAATRAPRHQTPHFEIETTTFA